MRPAFATLTVIVSRAWIVAVTPEASRRIRSITRVASSSMFGLTSGMVALAR
jgi:hypothetical protein